MGKPMSVTSCLRPELYNAFVKGSERSYHMQGRAIDFEIRDVPADEIRELLKPKLDEFGLRMEDLPGSSWVHLDDGEPGPSGRFFKP